MTKIAKTGSNAAAAAQKTRGADGRKAAALAAHATRLSIIASEAAGNAKSGNGYAEAEAAINS